MRRGMLTDAMRGNGVDLPYPIVKEISISPAGCKNKQDAGKLLCGI
jgi:hypothetical protein